MPKIKATAKWIENVGTIADNARTHSLVLDLGTQKGGDDTGPTALACMHAGFRYLICTRS